MASLAHASSEAGSRSDRFSVDIAGGTMETCGIGLGAQLEDYASRRSHLAGVRGDRDRMARRRPRIRR